jgi:hypothetical protein
MNAYRRKTHWGLSRKWEVSDKQGCSENQGGVLPEDVFAEKQPFGANTERTDILYKGRYNISTLYVLYISASTP